MIPEQIEIEGMRLVAPDYDSEPTFAARYIAPMFDAPCARCGDFKARMAALLDMLLGGPVTGGGILDELRAVRSALKDEGY